MQNRPAARVRDPDAPHAERKELRCTEVAWKDVADCRHCAMRQQALFSALRGGSDRDCGDRALLVESPAYGPDSTAIVEGGHKLIVRADDHELLFDLVADPRERTNRLERDPRSAQRLRELMLRMLAGSTVSAAGEPLVTDETTEEQLRALGYVE